MSVFLSFTCKAWGKDLHEPHSVAPSWAAFSAFELVDWCALKSPVEGDVFPLLENRPSEGTETLLRVRPPFYLKSRSDFVWVLYQPPRSAINGWEDAADEIPHSAVVCIEPLKLHSASAASAWLTATIRKTLPLTELTAVIPGSPPSSPLGIQIKTSMLGVSRTDLDDFCYLTWTLESDVGEWVLCRKAETHWRLLLYGEWGCHTDAVHVGNRELTPMEWDKFSKGRT